MNCNFSYKHYDELMSRVNKSNYKPILFHEDEVEKSILVRHDIDQDLESSLKLAQIEKTHNVKATYFLWVNSPFYNIFETKYRIIIEEIIKLGHEIGLHFDETAYKLNSIIDMKYFIDKEINLLEGYFDIKIKTVSFHRPSQMVLDGNLELGDLENTYSQRFIKEYKYISDSRGIWREGCLCKLLEEGKYNKIQVLTHPIWWAEEHNESDERIFKYITYNVNKFSDELANNISVYKKSNLILKRDVDNNEL